MAELVAATLLFIATHALPALGPLRTRLIGWLGRGVYLGLYSLLSIATLAWLALAFHRAPYLEIWPFAEWTRWVPLSFMLPACVLIVGGLALPNPFSLSFRGDAFDPERPGLLAVTRHPVPWGLALWAGAHIPPNGDAAALFLFAILSALSLYGLSALDRRRRAALGDDVWIRLSLGTSNLPLAALLARRARLSRPAHWGIALGGGGALYLALLFGHEYAIGVSPLP